MEEIWKDIAGYEGLYQVSNLGRVKSLPRTTKEGRGKRVISECILSTRLDRYGYAYLVLRKDKVKKTLKPHRLVAQHFINNPKNLPQVNHKDFNKINNCVENLEWVSGKENVEHFCRSDRFIDFKKNFQGEKNPVAKMTLKDVELMRKLREEYNIKIKTLSWIFDISISQVNMIIHYKHWNHKEAI